MIGNGATKAAIDGLKSQPFALALVVINVIFLIAGAWFLMRVGDAQQRRDTMIMQLAKDCGARP